MQLQPELREPLAQPGQEPLSVLPVLEPDDELSLDALGVISTGGVASLLAALLAAASTTPATLLLEELAHTQIRIEVLRRADRELTAAEHYWLDAGPITAGHHRTGLLSTTSGLVAAGTSLVILSQRIPPHARAALAGTEVPAGKFLPAGRAAAGAAPCAATAGAARPVPATAAPVA